VENLSSFPALANDDIEGYITLGSKYRATASTDMNATSSRSHAVFIVNLTMTEQIDGEECAKVSKVNLVDLAGSERSDAAGTSGQRLREGSAINKSLHTLGKVIGVLSGKDALKKKVFVPYRDSVLTWILKESLGGNAKTGMLATLSPSSENYEETLSTLRYAHQARSIVNTAVVNEDPNIKLIRELRAEVDALRGTYGDAKESQHNMAGGHPTGSISSSIVWLSPPARLFGSYLQLDCVLSLSARLFGSHFQLDCVLSLSARLFGSHFQLEHFACTHSLNICSI
jgi:kinesin family protein 14